MESYRIDHFLSLTFFFSLFFNSLLFMRVGPSLYLSRSFYIILFLFVYSSISGSFVSLGLVPAPLLGIIEHPEFMAVGFSPYLKKLKNDSAPPWLLFPAEPAPLLPTDFKSVSCVVSRCIFRFRTLSLSPCFYNLFISSIFTALRSTPLVFPSMSPLESSHGLFEHVDRPAVLLVIFTLCAIPSCDSYSS